MQFAGAQRYEAGDIVALSFNTPQEEAKHIVDTVQSLYGVAFRDGEDERGLSWSDMAILLRSVKRNGTPIVDALKAANIPIVVNGLGNLFETDEACAARDLFYFIAKVSYGKGTPISEKALQAAWENPSFGLTKANVRKAVRFAKRVRDDIHNQGAWVGIQKAYLEFLELVGLREERVPGAPSNHFGGQRGEVVLFNIGKFSQVISDWEAINFNSDPLRSFLGFANFLRYQAEGAYPEGWEDAEYVTPDAVQVMTVHQAKGREWPVIFIPALLRNRFPAINKPSDVWSLVPRGAIANAERYDGSLDDERRLFYVAMTRSKKFLHMTWAPGKSNMFANKSLFWEEVLSSKWVKRRNARFRNTPTPTRCDSRRSLPPP